MMSSFSRRLSVGAVFAGALLSASASQAKPSIVFTYPGNLVVLESGPPLFDVGTQELTVDGIVDGVSSGSYMNNMTVFVNGHVATRTWNQNGGYGEFTVDLPVGPDTPTPWPSMMWHPSFFTTPRRILKPFLAELMNNATTQVLARSRVTALDGRPDALLSSLPAGDDAPRSQTAQLTASGLAALEAPHVDMLPYPDPGTLLANLDVEVAAATVKRRDLVNPGCIPLTDAGDLADILALPAYVEAEAVAVTLFGIGETANSTGALINGVVPGLGTVVDLAAEAICVRNAPTAADFDLCVGSLEAELTDVDVQQVPEAALAYGVLGDSIEAAPLLDMLEATADVRLRGLSIQWRDRPAPCIAGVTVQIAAADIASATWLDNWATCSGLLVNESRLNNVSPVVFGVARSSVDHEQLDVLRLDDAKFDMPSPTYSTLVGTCAEVFLNAEVQLVMEELEEPIERVVGRAWDTGSSSSMEEAAALDLLLSVFDTGLLSVSDHEFKREYTQVSANQTEGLTLDWDSNVALTSPLDLGRESSFSKYHAPNAVPPSVDGLDPWGDAFDLSLTVTTGLLNQHVRALSATDRLRANVELTCAELGNPVGCGAAGDLAVLDGSTLGSYFPTFRALRGHVVGIRVTPLVDPFTWMPPDLVPPEVLGEAPVVYEVGHLLVEFVEGAGGRERVWLTAVVDSHDPGLLIKAGTTLGISASEEQYSAVTVLSSRFRRCPRSPHSNSPAYAGTCERQLETALYDLLVPKLEPRFMDLLAEIPAPVLFDAAGQTGKPVQLSSVGNYQLDQNVTFYGTLAP